MNGAGQVPSRPFAFLAHVHEDQFFIRVEASFHFVDISFPDAGFGFGDQLEKARRMLHRTPRVRDERRLTQIKTTGESVKGLALEGERGVGLGRTWVTPEAKSGARR